MYISSLTHFYRFEITASTKKIFMCDASVQTLDGHHIKQINAPLNWAEIYRKSFYWSGCYLSIFFLKSISIIHYANVILYWSPLYWSWEGNSKCNMKVKIQNSMFIITSESSEHLYIITSETKQKALHSVLPQSTIILYILSTISLYL